MHKHLVTSFNKNKIHLEKKISNIFYLIDYLPLNSHGVQEGQDFILNFKNGLNLEYYTDILTEALEEILGYDRENYVIIPIASSKKSINEIRYKNLLENLSRNLMIENGYSYVTVLFDTFEKHKSDDKFISKNNFEINLKKLEGKKIIIIDDVYTTGRSFEQYYFQLYKKVDSLVGVFLGKTNNKSTEKIGDDLKNFRFYKYNQVLDLKRKNLLPFNENGKNIEYKSEGIYEEYYLKNNKKNGKAFCYYSNGNYEEYFYLNNKKDGESSLYNLNGQIESTFYKDGIKENKLIVKYPTGAREEFTLINNKKNGESKFYSAEGKCYYKHYESDIEIKSKNLNLNKNLLSDGMIKIFKKLNFQTENICLKRIDTQYSEVVFKKEFGISMNQALLYLHYPRKILTNIIEKNNCKTLKIEPNDHKFYWDFSNSNLNIEWLDRVTFKANFTNVGIIFDDTFKIGGRGCTNFISKKVILTCLFELY